MLNIPMEAVKAEPRGEFTFKIQIGCHQVTIRPCFNDDVDAANDDLEWQRVDQISFPYLKMLSLSH